MILDAGYITTAGAQFLARADATGKRITWTRCTVTDDRLDIMSAAALRALTALTGTTQDGAVLASVSSVQQSDIALNCNVTNEGLLSGLTCYGFGIWAQLDGDLSDTLVFVAAAAGTPTTLNVEIYGLIRVYIDVTLSVSDFNQTQVLIVPGGMAPQSALAATNTALESLTPYVFGFENWIEAQANFVEGREFFVKGSQTRFRFRVPQSVTINNSTVLITQRAYRIMDVYKNYVLVRVGSGNDGWECIVIVYDLKTATVTGDLIAFSDPVVANYMARLPTYTYRPFCSLIEISGVIGVYGSYDPDDITPGYSYWGNQTGADYTSAFMPLFSDGGLTAGRWYGTSNGKAARAIGGDSGLAFLEDTADELETFLCRLSISGNNLVYTPITLNTPLSYIHQLWCEFNNYRDSCLGRVEFSRLKDGIWCVLFEIYNMTSVNLDGFYGDSTYTLNIYDIYDSNFTAFFQSRFGTNAQTPTTSAASMAFNMGTESFVFHTDEGFRIFSGYSFYTVRGFTELILAQKSSYSSDVSISNNGYDHLLNGEFYVSQSSNFMPNNTGFYGCVQGMLPAWNDVDPMISSDLDRRKVVFGNHFFTGDVAKVEYDSDFEDYPDQISYAYIQFVPMKNMRMRDGRV